MLLLTTGCHAILGGEKMANIKSAIKRVETNEKKRLENQAKKSDMRTAIKQVEKFVEANEVENAQAALKTTLKKSIMYLCKDRLHMTMVSWVY